MHLEELDNFCQSFLPVRRELVLNLGDNELMYT